MKKADAIVVMALIVILKSPPLFAAVSGGAAAFNALLREVDLNQDMQNGHAITQAEYEQLRSAWYGLSQADQFLLLKGTASWSWTATFVPAILNDLKAGKDWHAHMRDLTSRGVAGSSLTLSGDDSFMAVNTARLMLVDLLHKGANMFNHGRLSIDDELKVQAQERAGIRARQRLEKWERLINDFHNRPPRDKLEAINRFFNYHIHASADKMGKNGGDYWQSPIETLVRGVGDCDDFTMAKYVSLRLLGFPAEQLRVTVMKHQPYGDHAALLFFPPNERDPWVLDNLAFTYRGLTAYHILRLSERIELHQMIPLLGITEDFWTVFTADLSEMKQFIPPLRKWRKFSTALLHSQRVLPQTRDEAVSQLSNSE